MKRTGIAILCIGLLLMAAFLTWAAYITLIAGTTRGPDFIAGVQSGSIPMSMVSSIEIVEPPVGHWAFTKWKYDALSVRRTIQSPMELTEIVAQLAKAAPGRVHLNHPGTYHRTFLKVITPSGFYWLYVYVLQDRATSVLMVESNTCNATNPNGASEYHLKESSKLLSLIEETRAPESDVDMTP